MTDREPDELLKTDVLGRVRIPPEEREKMLDAFEAGGMSGQAFAIHHGIKVQTFASWIQKRRRSRGDYENEAVCRKLRMRGKRKGRAEQPKRPPDEILSLIEVQLHPEPHTDPKPPLEVVLPCGAVAKVSSQHQIGLLKILLHDLSC